MEKQLSLVNLDFLLLFCNNLFVGLHLTYKEINSILHKLEKEYLFTAKNSTTKVREGMYGVYTIKKVRKEILNYLKNK